MQDAALDAVKVHLAIERPLRAIVIADSLAMPRPGLGYEHTWPKLLADALPDIDWICRAARASTTERLVEDGEGGADCLEFYAPDIAILQLGICDSAPRLLNRRSMLTQLIYRLPFGLNHRISNWLEQHVGRQVRHAWVSPEQFRENLGNYVTRAAAAGTHVFAVHVFPAGSRVLLRNPKINAQIDAYNCIYDDLAKRHSNFTSIKVFQPNENADSFYLDGYHLNEQGGRRLVQALEKSIRSNAAIHRIT